MSRHTGDRPSALVLAYAAIDNRPNRGPVRSPSSGTDQPERQTSNRGKVTSKMKRAPKPWDVQWPPVRHGLPSQNHPPGIRLGLDHVRRSPTTPARVA